MIRVLVADDFSAIRRAMEQLVSAAEDMVLVGEAVRFAEAQRLIESTPCDVIVMNDYLPPMSSATATKMLRKDGIEIPIVVVSMHEDADLAGRALRNGANGFVLKTRFMDEFVKAIRSAHQGETFVSPPVAALLAQEPEMGRMVADEKDSADESGEPAGDG